MKEFFQKFQSNTHPVIYNDGELLIEKKYDIINVYKGAKCIRIPKELEVYIYDLKNDFDFYFSAVESKKENKYQVVDFTRNKIHKIRGFNLHKIMLPSFTEPISPLLQYTEFAQLDETSVVIDLGAYCGLAGILFDREISKNNKNAKGLVISVEADPKNKKSIEYNFNQYYKKTGRKVNYIQAAIWKNDGEITFASEGHMASSVNHTGYSNRGEDLKIPAISLSTIAKRFKLSKVDFIKCDIEGAETEIFKDKEFFELYSPKILIECHYTDLEQTHSVIPKVKSILSGYNYECREVIQDGFDLPLLECIPIKSKLENQPLVTVFLPYYNDQRFLGETIESILNQSYQNFELILFNHASTDNSRAIAHSFNDSRIRHVDAEENLGAGSGLNSYNLLNSMNGKYIKFFCADDTLEPNCLEDMIRFLETHPDKDFVFSDTYIINENGEKQNKLWSENKEEIGFHLDMNEKEILKMLFMRHSPLPFPGGLIKKSIIKPEFLDKSYIQLFDVTFWAELIISGAKLGFIKKPLMSYRINENQITSVFQDAGNAQTSFFEVSSAQSVYYKVKDYELLKAMCPNSPFIDQVTQNDIWAFEFIIAHYMLLSILGKNWAENFASYWFALQINAYQKIHDLLEDDIIRNRLKNKFGFGIKEFRHLYTFVDKHSRKYNTLKDKMFHLYKNPRELNMIDIVFLMLRRWYNLLTLRTLKEMLKGSNK